MKQSVYSSQRGFSLIELSAILTLAAILAVSYLQWLQSSNTEHANREHITKQKMEVIERAVVHFIHTHKRLPCPMEPTLREDGTLLSGAVAPHKYGWEDTSFFPAPDLKLCASPIGSVPVYALGLDSSYVVDGWNRRFTFHVSPARCDDREIQDIGCTSQDYADDDITLDGSFFDLDVTNNATPFPRPIFAMFVLLSHGENGLGAYLPSGQALPLPNIATQPDEYTNADGYTETSDTPLHASYVIESNQDGFDDILRYKTKEQIYDLTHKQYPLTITDCTNNSISLQSLDATSLQQMDGTIDDYQYIGRDFIPTNLGGEVVFDILWTLQNICADSSYYGTDPGPNWAGKLCPGGGVLGISGQCDCNSGGWNNAC